MEQRKNTKIVQRAYQNFKEGDIPSLLETLADDVEWSLPELKGLPFTGRKTGREQVAQFFSQLADMQEPVEFEVDRLISEGNNVVALGHYRWRIARTGKIYGSEFAHVFTLDNDRISSFQEFADTNAAAQAYEVHAAVQPEEAYNTR